MSKFLLWNEWKESRTVKSIFKLVGFNIWPLVFNESNQKKKRWKKGFLYFIFDLIKKEKTDEVCWK